MFNERTNKSSKKPKTSRVIDVSENEPEYIQSQNIFRRPKDPKVKNSSRDRRNKNIDSLSRKDSQEYRSRPKSSSNQRVIKIEEEFDVSEQNKPISVERSKNTRNLKVDSKKFDPKSNLTLELTPRRLNQGADIDPPFTFERRDRDFNDEIRILFDKMNELERHLANSINSIKIAFDEELLRLNSKTNSIEMHTENIEKRIYKIEDKNNDILTIIKEIESMKKMNEALEEERKKDIVVSKNYIDNQIQSIYNKVDKQDGSYYNEFEKQMQKFKFEVNEHTIEQIDKLRRELREYKYTIDQNTENIEEISNSIRTLKRKEETSKEDSSFVQSDNKRLASNIEKRVDEQIDDKLSRFKQHIKSEIRQESGLYIDEAIVDNNKNFVIPTIENHLSSKTEVHSVPVERIRLDSNLGAAKSVELNEREIEDKWERIILRRVETECKRIVCDEILPNLQEITERNSSKFWKSMINHEVPDIWKEIMETEVQIACKEIIEKEIEPTWKHVMIEEYSRTRRNIVEKEIEPTCREIIEDEVPIMWEKLINQEFIKERNHLINDEIRPAWREFINDAVANVIQKKLSEQSEKSIKSLISSEIEPIWRDIIKDEIEHKCRAIVDEDIESIWREAIKDELESWLKSQDQYQRPFSPPAISRINKGHVKSAKQLHSRISRIEESAEEESPEALPRHHLPPRSYVEGRWSTIMNSDTSNNDGYPPENNRFRYSAEPHGSRSRIFPRVARENVLQDYREERLKDYLQENFRPPSDSISGGREKSSRSLSNSKKQYVKDYRPQLQPQVVSFGLSDKRNDISLDEIKSNSSIEQYSK